MTIDMSVWELYKQSIEPLNKKNRADPHLDKPKIHIHVTVHNSNHTPLVQPQTHLKVNESQSSAFNKRSIEATIDLHGHTCPQAENQLIRFFHMAQQRQLKTVLVITGKGRSDTNDDPALKILLAYYGNLHCSGLQKTHNLLFPSALQHNIMADWGRFMFMFGAAHITNLEFEPFCNYSIFNQF